MSYEKKSLKELKDNRKWFKEWSKKGKTINYNKLYDLFYNDNIIITGVLYPVAMAKKNELISAGTHIEKRFKIKLK